MIRGGEIRAGSADDLIAFYTYELICGGRAGWMIGVMTTTTGGGSGGMYGLPATTSVPEGVVRSSSGVRDSDVRNGLGEAFMVFPKIRGEGVERRTRAGRLAGIGTPYVVHQIGRADSEAIIPESIAPAEWIRPARLPDVARKRHLRGGVSEGIRPC